MTEIEIRFLDYRSLPEGSKFLIFGSPSNTEAVVTKITRGRQGTTLSSLETSRLKDIYQTQGMYLPAPAPEKDLEEQPLHFLPSFLFDAKFPAPIIERINEFVVIPERYLVINHPSTPYSAWGKKLLTASSKYKLMQLLTLEPPQKVPPSYLSFFTHVILFPADLKTNSKQEAKKLWKLFQSPHITTLEEFNSFIANLKSNEALVKVNDTLFLTTNIIKN